MYRGPESRPSQEQRILNLLTTSYPEWTPAPVLARISLQYSARIFALRKKGWLIANRVEVGADGVKRGFFRLAQPMTWPNPKPKTAPPPTPRPLPEIGSGLLFDSAPERHRDDG